LVAAEARGITVSNTVRRGTGGYATADLAWGLILSLARSIPAEAMAMKQGGWQTTVGFSLEGRTLGLLGLGRLGRRMVPIARAFGMNVIAWSQNLTEEAAEAHGAKRVEKDKLFSESDFLSLHVVLSDRSRGIVGERELGLMKPQAYIVNTARGPLIDRSALIACLREKRIAGAALDTFDVEPLPDNDELRQLPNVLLTPHLGYTVGELLTLFYEDTAENILAFMEGKQLRVIHPT
jgi:D-3-phosphoglycerate dehydrogenase